MTPFRLAFLHLARRRVSSAIAAFAVAIAVACGGVLLRLYELSGSRFDSLAKGPDAVVGAKSGGIEILLGSLNLEGPFPDFVPGRLYESLRAHQSVRFEDGASSEPSFLREAVPFLTFATVGPARVVGTNELFVSSPADPKPLALGAWSDAEGEAIAGAQAFAANGWSLGQTVEARAWAAKGPGQAAMRLKLVGVLKPLGSAWDRALFSNLPTARTALQASGATASSIWGADVLHYYLIYLSPGGFGPLRDLVNKRTVAQAISVESQKAELERLTGSGRTLGFMVTALIIALAGLCMLTLLTVRFDSMAPQIAVFRAIGYFRREIAAWLLTEGAALGSVGCVVGAALDAALFPFVRALLGSALPDPAVASSVVWQSWPVWASALGASIAAAALPAARLMGQDVNASLKG